MNETSADAPPSVGVLPPAPPPRPAGWLWPALIAMAVVGGCAFSMLTYQIVTVRAEHQDLVNTRGGLEKQLADLRQRVDAANAEISVLAGKKQELSQRISTLDQERARRESETQRVKADLDALNNRRATLTDKIAEREKHEQELSRNVAPLERHVHELEQQRDRAISDLETAKAQLSQLRVRSLTPSGQRLERRGAGAQPPPVSPGAAHP